MDINFNGIPVFKGLQKPLEFMGIRGRFLTYAAAAIGISFLGFLLSSILFGKLVGFIIMVVLSPLVWLFIKKTGKYGMVAFTLLFLLRIWPPITLNGISAYFFTLGAWFSLSRKSLIIPTIWRIPIFSIAALCLGWFVVSGGNEQYIGWQLTPLFLLTGVLTTFYLADSLVSHQPQIKMPAILSDSSFFVYALHIEFALPIGFFISKMVTLHATHPLVMTIRYLLTPIIIYVLCVAVYAVMRRTVPRMLFLLTGNR